MKKTWIFLVLTVLLIAALAVPAMAATSGTSCACGEVSEGTCSTCGTPAYEWKPLESTDLTESGAYYLTEDMTIPGGFTIKDNINVVIDLNGKTVTSAKGGKGNRDGIIDFYQTGNTGSATGAAVGATATFINGGMHVAAASGVGTLARMYTNNTLILIDINVTTATLTTSLNGVLMDIAAGTVNIVDCTIDASNVTGVAGCVAKLASGAINIKGANTLIKAGTVSNTYNGVGGSSFNVEGGVLSLYDGEITGGLVKGAVATGGHGGSVSLRNSGATFNMYGGKITGGKVSTSDSNCFGGNIFVNAGTVNHSGGTVSGGVAGNYGGNVWLAWNAAAKYNLSGNGVIQNGTAAWGGGNVGIYGAATFAQSGGTIKNGVVTGAGSGAANIYVYGNYEISGGSVEGGTGNATTGSVSAIASSSVIKVSGTGKIDASAATSMASGAAINVAKAGGTLTMTGGTVVGGTVTGNGGAIAADKNAVVNISGGHVDGSGATANYGPAISVGAASVTISGGKVTGGTASSGGATIAMVANGGVLNISGTAELIGGSTQGWYGGGIIGWAGAVSGTVNISGGKLTGGSCKYGGPSALVQYTGNTLNITGGTIEQNVKFMQVNASNNPTLKISGNPVIGADNTKGLILQGAGIEFSIPAAMTAGANVNILCSSYDYTQNFATAADETIATNAAQYFKYNGSPFAVAEGSELYFFGALKFDTENNAYTKTTLYNVAGNGIKAGGTYQLVADAKYEALDWSEAGANIVLDLNGKSLTITGDANFGGAKLINNTVNGYTAGTGAVTVGGDITGWPARTYVHYDAELGKNVRYMTVNDNGTLTVHRIYLAITKARLVLDADKPEDAMLNYVVTFKTDDVLKAKLTYGMILKGETEVHLPYTTTDDDTFSVGITGAINAPENMVWAQGYLTLEDGWDEAAKEVTSATKAMSLRSLIEKVNARETIADEIKNAVKALLGIMNTDGWAIDKFTA